MLANGLATNTTLLKLDLLNVIAKPAIRSERFLKACIDAFQTNLTLKKIVWRLDHPLANTLARCITRNNSIARSVEQGKPFEQLLPDPLRGTGLVVLGASAATGQPSAVEARAGAAAAAVVPVEAAASTAAAEESASTAMEGGPASNLAVEEVASSTATATAAATAATATVANEPSAELEMALAAVATASSVQVEDQTATVKSTRDVIGLEEVVLAADGVPTAGASAAARDEVLSENVCTLNNGTCC